MTTRQRIIPCIWHDGTAEEAARLYTAAIPRSRILAISRYGKSGQENHGQPEGRVLMTELELDGTRLSGLNGGSAFKPNPSISLFVTLQSEAEVEHAWARLGEGGGVMMPLDKYPWSPRYGWLSDRFGVSWQIMLGDRSKRGAGPAVAPFLLFTGAQAGKAEAAMKTYAAHFPDSSATVIERHDGAGPDAAGTVKQGAARLGGSTVLAMDSAHPHAFGFNEGMSLMVMCETQAEIDGLWYGLTADGGSESQCGWLKDRFGVSWQTVPALVPRVLAGDDRAAADRVMAAVMGMRKIEIAKLEAALRGESV